MYSGYVEVNRTNGRALFYWLVEGEETLVSRALARQRRSPGQKNDDFSFFPVLLFSQPPRWTPRRLPSSFGIRADQAARVSADCSRKMARSFPTAMAVSPPTPLRGPRLPTLSTWSSPPLWAFLTPTRRPTPIREMCRPPLTTRPLWRAFCSCTQTTRAVPPGSPGKFSIFCACCWPNVRSFPCREV